MAEYIERERLVKHYENCIDEVKNTNGIEEDFEICLKALKAQPAADVVEVKHGKWKIVYQNEKATVYECSECNHLTFGTSDYCICGARMDDEGE